MFANSSPRNASNTITPVPRHSLRWDGATESWWCADANDGSLRVWSHDGLSEMRCVLPDDVHVFAHCSSDRLLLCQPKRLCFATAPNASAGRAPRSWRLLASCAVDPAEPRTSIHEGRTDRRGFFVFGTRNDGADARPIGSFYQYSLQHGLRRLALPAVTVATSICFSIDGRTLYFADGALARILQCDYDADSARIANVRHFAEADAFPGASVVDGAGNLWNAQSGAGRLVQYAPDGSMLQRLALPAGAPASPAFGGPCLDQLAVGSAAGLIRFADSGASGLHDALFADV